MKAQFRKGAFLVLLAMLVSLPAWPQGTGAATLSGTVFDPTGAVISGAELKLTQAGTGIVRTTTSDAAGRFIVPQLPPGTYRIEVKMSGFKTRILDKVEILVATTPTLDVHMEIGAIAEEVVVEGSTFLVNRTDASLGNPISGTEVQSLPQLDRNPAGLLSLEPGVTYIPSGTPDNPGGYGGTTDADGRSGSVSGARSDQTNVTLDGVDVNDPQRGYAFTSVLRVTQASLAEFRTTTTNYSPEAGGRSSAAQVQLVTKSGTNDLHGEAYYLHRNEAFNANEFFLNRSGVKEPGFRRHLYGVALGGPVVKDRFFLFGNWERLEEGIFRSAERDIPSPAFRDGVFIYRCAGGAAACPGNTAVGISTASYTSNPGFFAMSPADITQIDPCNPAGTCGAIQPGPNPAVLAEWANFPSTPNSSGQSGDPLNVPGFRFGAPVDNTFNTYTLKADFNITRDAKHVAFWRGIMMDDLNNSDPQFPGQPSRQRTLIASKGFALGYTAVFTPTVVNSFRWGLTRLKESTGGLQDREFVDFRFISNAEDYAGDSFGRTIPQHHIRDDVTWIRGKHALSFGGEMRYTRNSKFSNGNSFHSFLVNPSWYPDGGRQIQPGQAQCAQPICSTLPIPAAGRQMRDFLAQLLGGISQVDAFYNFDNTGATQPEGEAVARKFAVDEYEFYFQDQWRFTPSLTFTLGLRYFISSPPWEQNGNQVVPTPSLHDWFTCRYATMLAGEPTSDCGLINIDLGGPVNGGADYYRWDKNNWSPRIALAWAPRYKDGFLGWLSGDGKLAIRAGYSLVYDRMGNGLVTSFDEVGSFGMSTNITSFFGGCSIGNVATLGRLACARFSGPFDTAPAANAPSPGPDGVTGTADDTPQLIPSPGGGFPQTPPEGLLTVNNSIDENMVTPYAHTLNLTIARELPWDTAVEVSYVGRRGLHLLLQRDYAFPADWTSSACGVSVLQAQRDLIAYSEQNAGAADGGIAAIPASCFWETHFPGFGAAGFNGGCLGFDVYGVDPGFACGFSPTQVAYDYVIGYHGTAPAGGTVVQGLSGFGASTVMQDIDYFGFPGFVNCPTGTDLDGDGFLDCPNYSYAAQYVNLSVWDSVARSEYHALQVNFRKRMSRGVLFNLNYTLSKSLDHSSTPERTYLGGGFQLGGGSSGYALNAWEIDQQYAVSDFDMRHQVNAHWLVELPLGRGRTWGGELPGWANQILGGWEISGIFRANSGLPANVGNGRTWPTNWNYSGNSTCSPVGEYPFGQDYGACPITANVHGAIHGGDPSTSSPNIFADPDEALLHFRFTEPGASGNRNALRGDSYFNLDFGIGKTFSLPMEGHRLEFRWDMFNLTNTVYFDTAYMSLNPEDPDTFGDYGAILGAPRRMQVTLRYTF